MAAICRTHSSVMCSKVSLVPRLLREKSICPHASFVPSFTDHLVQERIRTGGLSKSM